MLQYTFWPAGVSLNYRVWSIMLPSLHWHYQLTICHHLTIFFPLLCVFVSDCLLLWCGSAHTLCAGTRLTNTVSSSSCDTVSPSQMMELIRSTMCMCTFWLWPLLGENKAKRVKCQQTGSKYLWLNWSKLEFLHVFLQCLTKILAREEFPSCNIWLKFALLVGILYWHPSQRGGSVLTMFCMTAGGEIRLSLICSSVIAVFKALQVSLLPPILCITHTLMCCIT